MAGSGGITVVSGRLSSKVRADTNAAAFLSIYISFYPGPLARFGDTAANAGILALLQSNPYLRRLPTLLQTVFASAAAAAFRMILTPIDTLKTTLQTDGRDGMRILKNRIKAHGLGTMWYGAFATAAATFVGHYPWFGTVSSSTIYHILFWNRCHTNLHFLDFVSFGCPGTIVQLP